MILDNAYISYVNLDKRTDRRDLMEQTLTKSGIHATWVRTRGMLPDEYKGPPERIRGMLNRPQKGAIGCYFSQLSVMEEAFKRKQHAFVMEDDLAFCGDFPERLEIITEFCRTHPWDIIWMGGTFHVNPPWWHKKTLGRDAEQTDNPRMMRTYGAFCTYAYLVNTTSLQKIFRMLEVELPKSIGIDYSFIQIQPRLHAYAFVPGCCIQYDHMSDIGLGMTIFSNFAKLGPYWFQQRMTEFDPTTFNWHEARRRKRL